MKLLAGIIGKNLQSQSVDLIEVAAVARDERGAEETKRSRQSRDNTGIILSDVRIKIRFLHAGHV